MNISNRSNVIQGIGFMLLGVFGYSISNVFAKFIINDYPIIEIVFFRHLFALIPLSLMMKNKNSHYFKTNDLLLIVFCAGIGIVGLECLFISFQKLPLADATYLAYASVLFVTALSGPLLKEYIDFKRWMAIVTGFIGVMIIAKPDGALWNSGIIYSLIFSLVDAIIMLSTRWLAKTKKPVIIVFYYSLFSTLISGLFLVPYWKTPQSSHLVFLGGIGISGSLAQICIAQAYKRAPAGPLAPMIYSSILWSTLFGYFIWGDFPAQHVWMGASVIIASGLYIIYRENKASFSLNRSTLK